MKRPAVPLVASRHQCLTAYKHQIRNETSTLQLPARSRITSRHGSADGQLVRVDVAAPSVSGRPTGGEVHLGGGGDGQRVFDPGRGVHRHAPVAPGSDLRVLGSHLEQTGVTGQHREAGLSPV